MRLTTQGGHTLEATPHHMMTLWREDPVLCRADRVNIGDLFRTTDPQGKLVADPVVAVEEILSTEGVTNVITVGNILANGVAVSVRVDGDAPDCLFDAGEVAYNYLGASISPAIGAANWLRKFVPDSVRSTY